MKKILLVLLCVLMVAMPVSAEVADEVFEQGINLMDSEELFNMMKDSVETYKARSIRTMYTLDSLEQEKYDSLAYVEGITQENRIVIAKMMAYRHREAQQVSQKAFENTIKMPHYAPNAINNDTSARVAGYYVQNKPTAIKLYDDYMSMLTNPWIQNAPIAAMAMRDQQFISYVKTGGPWDLKRPLGSNTSYQLLGFSRTGEYIGNHHYGYMGRHAGYNKTYLQIGAGIYQIVSGTSSWSYMSSYFDDPKDQEAINRGYSDYSIDLGLGIFY